jgi:flagellar assembly protein FliH
LYRSNSRLLKAHMVKQGPQADVGKPNVAPVRAQPEEAVPAAAIAMLQAAAAEQPDAGLEERRRKAEEVLSRAEALEARAAVIMSEAQESAGQKVAEAARQVDEMLSKAAEGALAVTRHAREEGFQTGRQAGYEEGLAAARAEAESIRAGALAQREELLAQARHEVLSLALAIAHHILKAEVTLRPEALLPMVEAALAQMRGEENPTVRLGPQAHAAIEKEYGRLLQALPGARTVQVEADEALKEGDFVVQGSSGYIDGRLQQQLKVVESALREELE